MLAVAGGGVQHLPMPIMTRCLAVPFLLLLTAAAPAEEQQWKAQAKRVTIVRDDWGIAHVQGARDADAVFGMMYAQAEDDFPRIEANYLTALGRSAEAEGEKAIWRDLRARLYVSEGELKAQYAASPAWLRGLMNAWAAGLNYYLAKHPEVRPRVLRRFEPWMALSFTEGSIGGDIERIDLAKLEQFYAGPGAAAQQAAILDGEPRGSNGIAIAPKLTSAGRALLLINPHTSFFFRSEQQVTSGQGLNAYGASTWVSSSSIRGSIRNSGGCTRPAVSIASTNSPLMFAAMARDRPIALAPRGGPCRRGRLRSVIGTRMEALRAGASALGELIGAPWSGLRTGGGSHSR